MGTRSFYVYILASRIGGTLYIGVTNDLVRRVYEHKNKLIKGFSYKHNVDKLLYYEATPNIEAAILREKQIKRWRREIKCDAIGRLNPDWVDLYEALVAGDPGTRPG